MFDAFAEQRILLIIQPRRDLCPIVSLQSPDCGWKKITLFHGNMAPFVLDEVASDIVDGLSQKISIGKYALDRLSDTVQTFGADPVVGCDISDSGGCNRITDFQLLEDHVLRGMMVEIGIDHEIGNNRLDDLVVRTVSASKDAQLPLENEEQLFDIAMFLA